MSPDDLNARYNAYIESLRARLPRDDAMRAAVGTDFHANGVLERELLRMYGLARDHYLIDVGCGSGRLAVNVSAYLQGRYLGIDINRELLAYAAETCGRPDWRFELGAGLTIAEADGTADMVCFFSVFTHLLHEQSYAYLLEARRVLKPGGRVLFTFLEFTSPYLWQIFEQNVRDIGKGLPLNVFLSRDAIAAWVPHLGMRLIELRDSDTPHIPIADPIRYDNGRTVEGMGWLGQSFCVLEK